MEDFLPAILVAMAVGFVMIKQIGKITQRIDAKGEPTDANVYAAFAGVIQEKIRAIKKDIDSSKETPEPQYVLKEGEGEEKALEELSDMIRKLVFFETMGAKRDSKERIESEMFGVLNELDSFVSQALVDGEALADELREELFGAYERIKQEA
jgi:valyl-tRNA synthetase